jgi:hypothetical protein
MKLPAQPPASRSTPAIASVPTIGVFPHRYFKAGDPIRDCELACHRRHTNDPPRLAACLRNCR